MVVFGFHSINQILRDILKLFSALVPLPRVHSDFLQISTQQRENVVSYFYTEAPDSNCWQAFVKLTGFNLHLQSFLYAT